ncbi:MAG: isochorismatase family protein [Bauldia litoralis]
MVDLDAYRKATLGNSSGWGRRPALLVVDFTNGFNDPEKFGGGNIGPAIRRTVDLLAAARRLGLPVAFTRVVYADDGADAGIFCLKAPALRSLTENNPDSHVVPELAPAPGEYVVRKQMPSAFFGTGLHAWLTLNGVDTVVHTGCTTSGCVRASVIDGLSHNYRNIVVTDCVGDRAIEPHEANLFDIEQKYADLVSCDEAIAVLDQIQGKTRAAE